MYKVYIENKVVVFSSEPVGDPEATIIEAGPQEEISLTKMLQNLQFTKYLNVISADTDALFEKLLRSSHVIEAAGGLVSNGRGEKLLIFRKGKWDLPKGKAEKGESAEECAVREVEEECSLVDVRLDSFLVNTYHCYELGGEWVLKRTWWYDMTAPGDQKPVPQIEEEITKAEWVSPEEVPERMKNTYGNIRDVMEAANSVT